jgi:hypothetical protein
MSDSTSKIHRYIIHTVFEYSKRNNMRPLETWKRFEQSDIVNFLTEHYEIQHKIGTMVYKVK